MSDISRRVTIVTPAVDHQVSKWKSVPRVLFSGVIIVIAAKNAKFFDSWVVKTSPGDIGYSTLSRLSNSVR